MKSLTDDERQIAQSLRIGALYVLLAWEAGEISEGVAAKQIATDRVSAREKLQAAIKIGKAIAHDELQLSRYVNLRHDD